MAHNSVISIQFRNNAIATEAIINYHSGGKMPKIQFIEIDVAFLVLANVRLYRAVEAFIRSVSSCGNAVGKSIFIRCDKF